MKNKYKTEEKKNPKLVNMILAILREDGEYGEYEGGPVQNDLPVH